MKEFVIFLLISLFPILSLSKTICSRRQYTISNSNFYQRIETPTAVGCIERCIENSDYCKSAVYVEQRETSTKMKRFCQLYGVNSESRNIRIKPEANYEPKTTLYEILDECPSDLSSSDDGYSNNDDIIDKISPQLKAIVRNIPGKQRNEHFGTKEVDITVNDDIHIPPDFEKLADFGTLGVSGSSFSAPPQYPFSPSSSYKESHPSKSSSPDPLHPERDPIPIQPISVSHAGQGGGGGGRFRESQASQFPCFSQNCRYQSQFSQSYPSQPFQPQPQPQLYPTQPFIPPPLPYQPRPTYPCPAARRGDPCAPKLPRCGPPPLPPCESYAAVEKITTELPKPYWSEWSPAGTCSVTCGSGIRQRKRFCSTGRESDCSGEPTLEEPCELPECDIWSEWGSYSPCSASCGGGEQERSRYCKNGRNCVGPGEERRRCAEVDCPHWSSWAGWHECSASCGQGMAKRSRDCLPIGSYDCPGEANEHQMCELRPCPEWGPWQPWSSCTKSCDGGERQRRRECLHGSSNECPGPAEEHILCNQQSCPDWTQWSSWSQCSATCGDDGTRLRNRQCQFEGFPSNLCIGTAQDQSGCQLEECPYFDEWSSWTSCSATCGHGQQTRQRKCLPKGYGCQGGDREMRFCQNSVCPYWDQWGEWGGCSVTCGRGYCERRRRCVQNALLPGGVLPSLDELEEPRAEDATDSNRKAALKDRLIERAQQLQGSRRNGINDQKSRSRKPRDTDDEDEVSIHVSQRRAARRKSSHREENDDTAIACVGPEVDRKECDAGPCCDWSTWASWSGCNAVCGTGSKVRSRICQVDVGFGGIESSTDFQSETLLSPFQSGIRPIRPQISMRGKRQAWNLPPIQRPQTYVTSPMIPPPTMDPRCDCPGRSVETEVCTASECPAEPQIDPCSWSEWSPWCGCSGNCQQGVRARTRYCNQEEDATRHRPGRRNFGSCDCPGEKVQTQDCLPTQCSASGNGRSSRPRGALLAERDSSMPKERLNEIGEFGTVTKKKKNNAFQRNEKPDDFIIKENNKDKSFEFLDDEDEVTSCSWSDWSEWTKCGTDFLKQRTRFCVGLKALINNCECRGATMQQTSCRPEKDGHNFKPPSPAVLSISRDILNDKLSSIDKQSQQRDDVHSDIPESPKTKIRPISHGESSFSSNSTGIKFLTGSEIITASDDSACSWSTWQAWSSCDAKECGEEGERKRKRECPCNSCNGGITTEIEICKSPPCSFNLNNHKKNPFD